MSGTAHIDQGLDESYEQTGGTYQELDNSSREIENTYDVAISSNSAKFGGCTTEIVDKHDVKKHCPTERTAVPKCLVATLAVVSCVAMVSLITAVIALIVVLTNNPEVGTTATSSTEQIILDRLSE